MKTLTFALAKGRLADLTIERMEAAGIHCGEMKGKSRKLVFTDEAANISFFLAKASDVPTYVEYGAADIGVAGKDTILEERRSLCEIADLGFGKCRVVVAGAKDALNLNKNGILRVATKYPNIAKDYFFKQKQQTVEIIKLNGSVELGPIVGLADVIVDIVETGSTLKANGLVVLDEICEISARVVVNQVSMKLERERIEDIVKKLVRE